MLWHFRKKSVDFYGDSDAVLGKLHENHLNLLIDPNYSTLFEILDGLDCLALGEIIPELH